MVNIDGFTRRFNTLPSQYTKIAIVLSDEDQYAQPDAYTSDINDYARDTKIEVSIPLKVLFVSVLTTSTINDYISPSDSTLVSQAPYTKNRISSVPILLLSVIPSTT